MKRFKCSVEKCGHVTRTKSGIVNHISRIHPGKEIVKGQTYDTTHDALTNPRRNGPFKTKKRKTKTLPIITDVTEYIDVPCYIRITVKGLTVQGLYPS